MVESTSGFGLFSGEQMILCRDDSIGLRAAIAIDDTTLGPGIGGVRLASYPNETAALIEAQRLAATMTLKNAVAELPYGGAKSVIIQDDGGPPTGPARAQLMRRFGEFVARTSGTYLPGVDMGTTVEDLAIIGQSGAPVSCSEIDPSPWTALGVASAIRAAVAHVDSRSDLEGVRVLIQGVGHVGATLAHDLAADGAVVMLSDIDANRASGLAEEIGGSAVPAERALDTPCDVFAPCAAARVVSQTTRAKLACRIIAGAANDALANRAVATTLAKRGIIYVPDFVTNAGGVIHVHALANSFDDQALRAAVEEIGDRVTEILDEAELLAETPLRVAERRAARILAAASTAPGARELRKSQTSSRTERLAA